MTREEALNIIGICLTMARVDLEFSQDEKHWLHELCNSISISDKEKGQMKSISGSLSEMVQCVENEDSKNTLVELLSLVAATVFFESSFSTHCTISLNEPEILFICPFSLSEMLMLLQSSWSQCFSSWLNSKSTRAIVRHIPMMLRASSRVIKFYV
jgi:hypothetical protein